jgi:hypothetical protein
VLDFENKYGEDLLDFMKKYGKLQNKDKKPLDERM